MGHGRPGHAQPFELGRRRVNVVRQDGVTAGQPEPFVDGKIVGGPRKQARRCCDFGHVLVDVCLTAEAVVFAEQRLTDLEHRFARGQRKPRRDGINKPPTPVEAANQAGAVAPGAVG
jgi:hypothetical protein